MAVKTLLATIATAALAATATAADCSPEQIWINYGDAPDQMIVSWATPCESTSVVQYGRTPSLGSTATGGPATTYSFLLYTSPYLHNVTLTGLAPNSTYYYAVGGDASGMSDVVSFVSHPGVGAGIGMTFAIIGDLGQTSNSNDTVQHILASSHIDAVIHAGDLSYADEDEERWDSWRALVQPLASRVPWLTTCGNHEIESMVGVPNFLAYTARFRMPQGSPAPSGGSPLYYSVETGPVHWTFASSYSDFDSSSDQYAWLKSDFAAVDRSRTPWLFVVLHAPWYNSNTAHQQEGESMRKAVEDLVFAAGVDMVFAGHVHAYERNHRVYNYARNPAGPVYITIGDGGNREGLASKWLSQPSYSDYRMASYGHGELTIVNSTAVYWAWHDNQQAEPVVTDSLWLIKGQDA